MAWKSRVGLVVGVFLLLVCLSPGWLMSHDAADRLTLARALWTKGTVFVDHRQLHRSVETEKGFTTYFGIGQTLAFLPFDLLGALLGKVSGVPSSQRPFAESLPLLFLYAPLVGVFWWGSLIMTLRRKFLSEISATALGTMFFFCTLALPYSAQSLQEEAVLGALLATLLSLLLGKGVSHGRWEGCLLGCLFLFRLNTLFAAIPLAALWWEQTPREYRRLRFMHGIQGALLPLALFAFFNGWRFGSPFSTGYDLAYSQLAEKGITTWKAIRPRVASQLLFGSGKGFFFLSPILLVALLGFGRLFKGYRIYSLAILFSLVLSALVHSKLWGYSCGGISWGPRFQIHFLSHFILPFAWGMEALLGKEGKRLMGQSLFALLVLMGLAFQVAACLFPDSLEYHQEMLRRGNYKEELVTSLPYGQLSLRISNIFRTIHEEPLLTEPAAPALLGGYRTQYFPNFWGNHFSKALGPWGPWGRRLWSALLLLAVTLVLVPLLRPLFFRSTGHLRPLSLKHNGCSPM